MYSDKVRLLALVTLLANCYSSYPDHYTVTVGFIHSTPPGTQVPHAADSPYHFTGSHSKVTSPREFFLGESFFCAGSAVVMDYDIPGDLDYIQHGARAGVRHFTPRRGCAIPSFPSFYIEKCYR